MPYKTIQLYLKQVKKIRIHKQFKMSEIFAFAIVLDDRIGSRPNI